MSHTPSIEQCVMVSRCGRDHGPEIIVSAVFLEEDATHLNVIVDPMVADRVALIRGPGNVSIAGGTIISLRSAGLP